MYCTIYYNIKAATFIYNYNVQTTAMSHNCKQAAVERQSLLGDLFLRTLTLPAMMLNALQIAVQQHQEKITLDTYP